MICDIHGVEMMVESYYRVPYCPKCVCQPRNRNADTKEVEHTIGYEPMVKITIDVPSLN